MAEAILFNLAQNLIQTLASEALQAAASIWGFRSELQRLEATTNAIKNVILDAEDRQAEDHAVQDWLKRLKAVLYTTDDLFDEYATLASRKTIRRGNKCSKEPVLNLFHSEPGNAILKRNVDAAFHECGTVKSFLEETLGAIPDWVLDSPVVKPIPVVKICSRMFII